MMSPPFQHGARLTIDLGAIVANWRALAARAAPAACAAVVKADAYGCGLEPVVDALARAGCDTFFVAHLSEGARARRVARNATIYVLNGLPPGATPLYAEHGLRPVLGSGAEIAEWLAAVPNAPAALHIDTGMNRLGLAPDEIDAVPAAFRPALVMSHLIASEVPDDPANARQIARFSEVAARFPDVPSSLCNSSGIFLSMPRRFDLVRPGIALYGSNPTPWTDNPMRGVVTLEAAIAQVREIGAGESVGYNATWIAPRKSRIATVSLGYADGYMRTASATNANEGGAAIVDGARCPIVGRVSMDLITLDITDAPNARRGERATFIGEGLPVDIVAGFLRTNSYEVLTSLGRRFERVYVGGGESR